MYIYQSYCILFLAEWYPSVAQLVVAVDCSASIEGIHRSLVQFRPDGRYFFFFIFELFQRDNIFKKRQKLRL